MADPRMSQLLPTIRCGTCGRDVAYRELGTHLCEEAPAMPELPFLLSNKIKENVVKSDQPPPSPNGIQSPKSLPGDGYDSGYNSRVASSGSFADKMDQDFDRSRPSLRISTVNVSSGFLEKYGRFTSQTPDVDESEYEDDNLQSVDERTVRSQEITRNVSLDFDCFNNRNTDRDEDRAGFSPRSELIINDLDGSPDRDDFSPRYEQSNTAEIVQPNSDDDTASRYSHRSARSEGSRPKPRTYASRPVYGGRERFISEETFDECNDDTHSVSHSVRSSPDRRRSMRSSNGSSSAQEYIERKYGISPPTGKEGQPLPPPKLDTSTQDDPAARSGSTPFSKFLQNLFSPNSPTKQVEKTSPNDDFEDKVANLSNGMESMGITSQMPVLIKPRDADGTITEKTKCGSCQRQIFASEKYLEAIGLTFHRSCFRCDQCDVPIDHKSNFLHVNGEVLCQLTCGPAALEAAGANLPAKDCAERVRERTEYKRDELHCHDCHEPITDRPVYAMRNPYHEGHLRCKCCRSPIQPSVGHVEHEGNVYCPSDFAQLILPKCNTCEKPIEGEAVCALDQKWHPECFGCQVCGDLFPNKSFYVFDNKPLCRRHYHKQNNSLCRTCDEPIEGPCAQVQPDNQSSGKRMDRYHPPCFSCTECRRPLNDIYYNFGGNPYCERHIMEIQRKKNIRVERRRTVFSVLPPGY